MHDRLAQRNAGEQQGLRPRDRLEMDGIALAENGEFALLHLATGDADGAFEAIEVRGAHRRDRHLDRGTRASAEVDPELSKFKLIG